MSNSFIGPMAISLQQIRSQLKSSCLNSIRGVLPDRVIEDGCRQLGHGWRDCFLTPVVTVFSMIAAALWPEDSFRAAWHLLWDGMRSLLPEADRDCPGSGALAKARARLPLTVWQHLFDWLSEQTQTLSRSVDAWRGHRVVLADGTCLSMSDTPELHEAFGSNNTAEKPGKFPLAKLVTLAVANTMTVIGYSLGRYRDDETALFWPLLKLLKPGDLLIADRHFAAAHYYVDYLRRGLQFITRKHQSLKLSNLKIIKRFTRNDYLAEMRVGINYRKADPTLPEVIVVRVIRVKVNIRGQRKQICLISSLLNPLTYPASEIAELYRRRWRIETLLKEFKINLSADVLRSQSPEGIRKEVAARLMAVNILRTIMLEAALAAGVDPMRLSFVGAVRAILAFAPRMATVNPARLPVTYQALLRSIASKKVPWRPGRIEPRMIKREKKHFPTLRTTRLQWRLDNVA